MGITVIWLPPAYKAFSDPWDSVNNVGYAVYDLYDLGEFNQKGAVRTKYGTKDQYLAAIQAAHDRGLKVYADIVLNHKMGADAQLTVSSALVQSTNRSDVGSYSDRDFWALYVFNDRADSYSSFKWDSSHFDGSDLGGEIYLFDGKSWDSEVDNENVNYDYLMGCDVDFDNADIVSEYKTWAAWYVNFANLDGFRIDAVKHIKFSFFPDWLNNVRSQTGRELFAMGEYWHGDVTKLNNFITASDNSMSLFDVALHYNLYNAAEGNGSYDLRNVFNNSLVAANPSKAVTFVDNHDSQPGQALVSFIAAWFKQHAYALILLREAGIPCVFYGDLYGGHDAGANAITATPNLQKLVEARKLFAYGTQHDYFISSDIIGWSREGDDSHINSGVAVIMSDNGASSINMNVGMSNAGATFYDWLGNNGGTVVIDGSGNGDFPVDDKEVSVWVRQVGYSANNLSMYVRGTFNGWAGTNPMALVANNVWLSTINSLSNGSSFKFEVTGSDTWGDDWGDAGADGIAGLGEGDITVPLSGTVVFVFNDATLSYSLTNP